MKYSKRITYAYLSTPKLYVKPKKTKYEKAEETLSDKSSEHDDTENVTLPSEESVIEEAESSPTINYISSNNVKEVSVEYDESNADSIYDSRNNDQLFDSIDVLMDSDESDATDK
ncbi:19109_t:CDS:2, partial [Racocetra fulgida]